MVAFGGITLKSSMEHNDLLVGKTMKGNGTCIYKSGTTVTLL